MSHLDELKAETREIITDLLNDGSDPNAEEDEYGDDGEFFDDEDDLDDDEEAFMKH